MSRIGIAAATFALVLATFLACGSDNSPSNHFTATMNSANEVPAVTTASSGTGTATFTVDGGTVNYTLTYTNLTGRPVNAHIHAGTATTSGGPVTVPLPGFPTTGAATSGQWSGSFDATKVQAASANNGAIVITAGDLNSLLAAMRAGNTYTNIHTAANGGGEVRGPNQPQ